MLFAYSEATAPKITLTIRKAYGGSYLGMCSKDLGADAVFCWPTTELAVMGPEGAAAIIFRKELEKADDPDKLSQEKIKEYRATLGSNLGKSEPQTITTQAINGVGIEELYKIIDKRRKNH